MRNLLYIFFLILRILAIIQPGYIHPDEFFQGGQELFFGCPNDISELDRFRDRHRSTIPIISGSSSSNTKYKPLHDADGGPISIYGSEKITATWEFQRENAVRSIVPPSFMTVLPLWAYSKFRQFYSGCNGGNPWNLSGWEILMIPRMFMAFLSIITVDLPMLYIVRKREAWTSNSKIKKGVPIELGIFASSWTTISFLTRPFSNSLETFCISLLCAVAMMDTEVDQFRYQTVLVPLLTGLICSVGLFVRFTFAIFALPIVLTILSRKFVMDSASMHAKLKSGISCIVLIAIPFLMVSSFFVYQDVKFYSTQGDNSGDISSTTTTTTHQLENIWKYMTPWNAFRYNSKIENLSDHGIHPRITHLLVNFPMLFGPAAIYFYMSLSKTIQGEKDSKQHSRMDNMLRGIIVFGLGVLSCAPHQEPRFLLPLVVPLILLHARELFELKSYGNIFMVIWVIFNILLMTFFGIMHQGAVTSSVMSLSNIFQKATVPRGTVIYYNTYMPPTFLLRQHTLNHMTTLQNEIIESSKQNCPDFFIFDAQSSSKTKVLELLSKIFLRCETQYHDSVYLVAPKGLCEELSDEYRCRELWSSFQISTENLPPLKSIQDIAENSRLSVNRIEWVSPVCTSQIAYNPH
jgi:Alg9-like mannosyltransferase family.